MGKNPWVKSMLLPTHGAGKSYISLAVYVKYIIPLWL